MRITSFSPLAAYIQEFSLLESAERKFKKYKTEHLTYIPHMATLTIIFRNGKPFSESRIKYSLEIVMVIDEQQFRLKSTSYIFLLVIVYYVYSQYIHLLFGLLHQGIIRGTGMRTQQMAHQRLTQLMPPSLKMSQWAVAQ